MDELGYQLANAIISQIKNQLHQVEDDNPTKHPPDETETVPGQEHISQANATQGMATLMSTMMQTMEHTSVQLATQNTLYNGDPNGENHHRRGYWCQTNNFQNNWNNEQNNDNNNNNNDDNYTNNN